MIKEVIKIDEELCIGCAACANTCLQAAIEMVDGKARVVADSSCDGLGRCLPVCPVDAISFVKVSIDEDKKVNEEVFVCPSSQAKTITKEDKDEKNIEVINIPSCLQQWPVQIQLVMPEAPFFENADLLIAADCTAFANPNFHQLFMKDKITLIGCPKLDQVQYAEKLSEILSKNNIKSVSLVKMEVPCCGGLEYATRNAIEMSGKDFNLDVTTIGINGEVLN